MPEISFGSEDPSGPYLVTISVRRAYLLPSEKSTLLGLLAHELLHSVDKNPKKGQLSYQNSDYLAALAKERLISKPGPEQIPILTASSWQKIAELDEIRGNRWPAQYTCTSAQLNEFFACTGTIYLDENSAWQLKADFPALYDYYKEHVFGGREYLKEKP